MADEARRTRCFSCMAELNNAEEHCQKCGWDNRNRVNDDDMLEETVLKDQYLVGRALGRGGFGVTYMGFDLNLDHRVAIKEYFPPMSAYRYTDRVTVKPKSNSVNEYTAGLQRAFREAQTVANLGRIPNIVQVYNVFQANGTVYIVMDYVEGTTLYRMVKQNGPMGWRRALELLYPIMRVLEKVHARRVIHRDVSPDNIMLDQKTNETVLLDFGAAREEDAALTVILKPGFAPFEQYNRSEWKDGRTDEYALCATMYYLLTGQPPESADKRNIMKGVLKTPRMLGSDVPENVEAVLLKGMSVRSDDRYESVAALRSAFERAEKGEDRDDSEGADTPAKNGEKPEDLDDSEHTVTLAENGEKREDLDDSEHTVTLAENGEKHEGLDDSKHTVTLAENGEKGEGLDDSEHTVTLAENGEKHEGLDDSKHTVTLEENGEKREGLDDSKHTVALKDWWERRRVHETAPWGEETARHSSGKAGEGVVRKKRGAVSGLVKGLLALLIIIVGLNVLKAFNIISPEKLTERQSTQEAGSKSGNENATTETTQASSSTPVIQTGEISDSWDEIIAAIDDGSARQRYAVGATKALDLGALGVIHMQLAGFDLDERTDGGKAATTWIAVELLPEAHVMNKDGSNEGGWRDSELRAYLQDTVYKAVPDAVRDRLVQVKKTQYDAKEKSEQSTDDLIWIPDKEEVYGDDSLYYGLFRNLDENRIKRQSGSAPWWWLRSANNYSFFYGVNGYGYYGSYGADISGGVALGFCLGRPVAPNAEPAEEVDSRSGNENATTETTQASSSTPVIQTGEISDSWDQILAAIDDGSARQRYAVGATKELDLGALGVIHMQLAGFDLDERTDGGKVATTWIAVELLPERHVMNKNGSNEGGWRDSELRAYLRDTVYKAVPDAVRDRLVQVKKTQYDAKEKSEQSTDDLIWIPDTHEVIGDNSLYYGLFKNSLGKRIKQRNGSAAWWWLRSANNGNSFYAVNISGGYNYFYAYHSGGVALGFCL